MLIELTRFQSRKNEKNDKIYINPDRIEKMSSFDVMNNGFEFVKNDVNYFPVTEIYLIYRKPFVVIESLDYIKEMIARNDEKQKHV